MTTTPDSPLPPAAVVGWADDQDNPEFGAAMRYGSRVCGWPRHADGSCLQGHRREVQP